MTKDKTGAPRVTEMQVIPVAGQDSMLLNLSGAHAPYFTRNLVILTDSAGNTWVGEVPGGEKIRQTLEGARDLVVGAGLGTWNNILSEVGRRFADRDSGGRGLQTFDLRITVHCQAALGWAVMSDAAPREATGLSGSIFNLFGNAAGIFTPIGIGYILAATNNSWDMALLFVFAHSIVAMVSYLFITGTIKRVVLRIA